MEAVTLFVGNISQEAAGVIAQFRVWGLQQANQLSYTNLFGYFGLGLILM